MNTWLSLNEKGPRGARKAPVRKSRNKCGGKTSVATAFLYTFVSE